MKVICFATVCLLTFVYNAECAVDGWTKPVISTGDGSGTSTDTIAEDAAAGASAVTVAANSAASYAVISQVPTTGGTFTTIDNAGIISFSGSFDYETASSYAVVIEATEDASNKGTATVTISITDVNDNDPTFAATVYGVNMNHGAAAGKAVLTVTATDADGTTANNAISTYAISAGGNTGTDFAIDSSTGKITVANALSKTRTAGYALEVTAADSGTTARTGTTTVLIVVTSSDAVAIMSGMVVTMIAFLVARFL